MNTKSLNANSLYTVTMTAHQLVAFENAVNGLAGSFGRLELRDILASVTETADVGGGWLRATTGEAVK